MYICTPVVRKLTDRAPMLRFPDDVHGTRPALFNRWVMSHIRMSHVHQMNKSCPTYDSQTVCTVHGRFCATHMNESCHVRMGHVTHTNESCRTYGWSCHIYEWDMCDMAHAYVWHNSLTRLTHIYDVTRTPGWKSKKKKQTALRAVLLSYVTWLIHMW